MIEWHILDPSQELADENGAAILCVARELSAAAREHGESSFIVGGSRGSVNLPEALPLLKQRPTRDAWWLLERAFRYATGESPRPALRFSSDSGPRPDRVLLHNLPWGGAVIRRRFAQASILLYVHNRILNGLPARSVRRALSHFDEIVCVSDSIRHDLEARSRFRTSRAPIFRTVRNAARSSLSFSVREPVYDVVYVGRLVHEKGVHVLMQAAALPGSKWRIAVVGGKYFVPGGETNAYVQDLRRQAEAHKLHVDFTGPVSPRRVADYLGKSLVSVVPSVWEEPAGLTLLESMASPAAVVASRVGGLQEASKEGGVIYVPPSDPQALRTAVDDLLADESNRKFVVARGCQEVKNRTWKHVYEELTSI